MTKGKYRNKKLFHIIFILEMLNQVIITLLGSTINEMNSVRIEILSLEK
ncbi:MAG: hypothetical protein Lokiarch_19030 [Candidatus Lokiarchaeum sp. GC14_75]|nr:MAG: hypothetical protein Lokiarch_19030 [Candidatus Lokiarchaeum sp. GC14_75]